ncbi:MAG: flagellar filament capping protein FliD [Candidatus Hydrogenedentes bacterium]|nr:flagellar filament capping protein FliD [Candidatus Hydrogenedentota bacterium]
MTVSSDDDKIVESVTKFIDAYNKTVQQMVTLSGKDGALENDNSIQTIENYLKTTVFSQIAGISGSFSSLVDLGITTGDTFDPSATQQLSLDETEFRAALQSSRQNVSNIFTNTGSTGIADQWYSYLDSVTSFTGFLNDRVKSSGTIDRQIKDINDQITRKNAQIAQHETRLRAQFTMLEQIAAQYQSQGSSLSSLASRFGTVA